MAQQQDNEHLLGRRDFIKGLGVVVAAGAITGLASCTQVSKTPEEALSLSPLVLAKRIFHRPDECAGCNDCVLACSLFHTGKAGEIYSRGELVRDPFGFDHRFNTCQQCLSPGCYIACPLKDKALCIDETTGLRYVNEEACDGCGKCVDACRYQPSRMRLDHVRKVAYNCDLCRDRTNGPACVEYCPTEALSLAAPQR